MPTKSRSLRRLLSKHSLKLLEKLCGLSPPSNIAIITQQGQVRFERHDVACDVWRRVTHDIAQSQCLDEAKHCCLNEAGLFYYPLVFEDVWLGGMVWSGEDSFATTVLLPYLLHEIQQAHEKRVLMTETLDRYRELNLIFQAGESIGLSREQEPLYELILQECQHAIQADAGVLLFENEAQTGWEVKASFGDAKLLQSLEASAQQSHSLLNTKERADILTKASNELDDSWPFTAWMWTPLQTQEHRSGGLLLARQSNLSVFVANDLKLLTSLGWLTVLALDNVSYSQDLAEKVEERTQELQQHMMLLQDEIKERKRAEGLIKKQQEELLRLTQTDELTGLYNRRFLFERGKKECALAQRYQSSFSVLMLDVDHFKQINDRYGHDVGDEVLRQIAAQGTTTLRETDTLCRYGGEEFAVLLPQTPAAGAVCIAERLRASLAEHPIPTEEHGVLHITVSVGVSSFTPGKNLDTLLKQADVALYQAKKKGRNRVEMAACMKSSCLPCIQSNLLLDTTCELNSQVEH